MYKLKKQKYIYPVILVLVIMFLISYFGFSIKNIEAAGNIYYVATTGNDSNPGTISQPWRTIGFAASTATVQSGDTVYVRGGTYNESITQTRSGTSGAVITYSAYPGETPIIGDSAGAFRWKLDDQSYITITGFTFSGARAGGIRMCAVNGNISDITITNNIFTNNYLDPAIPGHSHCNIGTYHAILADTTNLQTIRSIDNIVIDNNTFTNWKSDGPDSATWYEITTLATSVHNSIITNNTYTNAVAEVDLGITIYRHIGYGTRPTNILISGNTLTKGKTQSAGIYVEDGATNVIVENNVVSGYGNGISVNTESQGSDAVVDRVIVRRNKLFNNSTANIHVGGVGTAGCGVGSNAFVKNSVIVHNTFFQAPTISYQYAASIGKSCTTDVRIKNNILDNRGSGSGKRQYSEGPTGWPGASTITENYNLFNTVNGTITFSVGSVGYPTLANYQSGTGRETNALSGDPLFTNPGIFDFTLQPGSPAINAGSPLTTAIGSGSGTVVTVADYRYFTDGFGLQSGDLVRIGNNSPVRVTGVNSGGGTITLASLISWNNNDPVSYDYSGSAPDIGMYELVDPPPVITNVQASNITQTSVTISWNAGEPATGQIEYGTTVSYGLLSILEPSFDYIAHSQILSNLLPGTLYHYRVKSADASGNMSISGDYTFTTLTATDTTPPSAPGGVGIQ